MAITKLQLYNAALMALGETRLASLAENREARHNLDEIWDRGQGAVERFLEQGLWNFAMRAVEIDASSSVTPAFGFQNAFDVPSDFVRLAQIADNADFYGTLEFYEIEAGYFYANVDPIYIRYVSNHDDYGASLARWPETFSEWAGLNLAVALAPTLKSDLDMDALRKRERKALLDARSKDASQERTRYAPPSGWQTARRGGHSRGDLGSRSRLIG